MSVFSKLYGDADVVGLDIGSHSVKVVQLDEERGSLVLRKAGTRPTPAGATKGGVVTDSATVAQTVSALLGALEIPATQVLAAVAGPTVVVRQVQMPYMSERQLRKSIQWEARSYISFPVEDSILEFQVLGQRDGGQLDVMLVATPRDMVETRVEALERAGLEPIGIELEPFATMRSLIEFNGQSAFDTETVALVDSGASFTEINIVKNRNFVLTRTIPIAGNSMTEAIASALAMDNDKANALKETAMQVVCSEEERATLDPFAQQASRAVEPLLDELIREIRRSLAYYDYQQQAPAEDEDQNRAPGVNRIILSGGTAKMAGLAAYFQAQLGVPVEQAGMFSHGLIQTPGLSQEYLDEHSPTLVVAAGLALREIMLSGKLNLRAAEAR
ncbi:MAG: type IV pilus assembly protein PilM [Armatimonadota bacterium]|nr:MAG: type IV pilus assembly protein PilM [Armatimonadota bacterium]